MIQCIGSASDQPAGADDADVRDRQADDRPLAAGQRIDDRRARLDAARQRIVRMELGVERAVELVQDLHRLDAALAVADQHRPHAVVLVVPRDQPRAMRAALVRAVRPARSRGSRISALRVAHADQEPAKSTPSAGAPGRCRREIRMMRGVGPCAQHVAHVGVADALGIEGEDAIFERRIERHRPQHAAGRGRVARGRVGQPPTASRSPPPPRPRAMSAAMRGAARRGHD